MNSTELKNRLTTDDIIKLCCHLQKSDDLYYDNQGNPIFNTCLDHPDGDSWKLYYFPETKLFHCFTGSAETYDIFELVCRALGLEFAAAFRYVIDFFGIKTNSGFQDEPIEALDDWDIFQQVEDYETLAQEDGTTQPINENLVEYFYPKAAPIEWLKDGISPEVMDYYGIRIDDCLHKIIIPHRNINGELIGIRGRSYNPMEVEAGKKYMPVFIEGEIYKHPLGKNLFGLYENKETIKKLKKVLICESEKSVMQAATFYGVDNCFVVATCGSSLSQFQIDLLMQLNIEEVILGFDKEYTGNRGEEDEIKYEEKLLKIIQPLSQYFNTYVIMDFDGLLSLKDSPTDRGKEVLEKLMKKKIYIPPIKKEINKRSKRHGL